MDSGDVAALQSIYQEWGIDFDFESSRLNGDDPPRATITDVWDYEEVYEEMDPDDPFDDVFLGYQIATDPDRVIALSLTASVPQAIGGLSELDAIFGDRRGLAGTIPASIGNLSKLTYMNLTGNDLTGSIPRSIGQLAQLESIDLSHNELTGKIPDTLAGMSRLKSLVLNNNQLSDSIPNSLGSMPVLESLRLQNNQLSGELPPSLGQLSTLVSLDLDDNELEGDIPASLGDLASLAVLDLSSNRLSGTIPRNLGNMGSLDGFVSLNLSGNELEGAIPEELASLGGTLRLNNNYLSGTLPENLFLFEADDIVLSNNLFNMNPGSASAQIIAFLGDGSPNVFGFESQRAGFTSIHGLESSYAAAGGFDLVIGPVTVRNHSDVPITGSLHLGWNEAVPSAGEVTIGPMDETQLSVRLPIDSALPVFDYNLVVSFEGGGVASTTIMVGAAVSPIGTALSVTGEVVVERGGERLVLEVGAPLFTDDLVETGIGASAEFELVDGTSFTLEGNAVFVVDEYFFDPENPDGNTAQFSILRGAFIFISGLITKNDPDGFAIDTPTGSLGIRGTEFTTSVTDDGTQLITEIDVTEGLVEMTNLFTGEIIQIPAGESHQSAAPYPSLDTVRFGVSQEGGISLDLAGYIDTDFVVQRSSDLATWSDWRVVEPSELPITLPETSPDGSVFYRLVR